MLLGALLAGSAGCGDAVAPPDAPTIEAVRIFAAADTMSPAETTTFRALPSAKDGSPLGVAVSWTSTNPAVATVDGAGAVNALATGTATITAAAGGKSDSRTVTVLRTWKAISAGDDAICGITLDDRAWCWGRNYAGQLGDGTTQDRATAAPVAGDHRWSRLSLNFHSACGVTLDPQVLCWGSYDKAYFSNIVTTPSPIPQAPALVTAEAGFWAGCGLTAAREAWCWGRDNLGGLGDGTQGSPDVRHYAVAVSTSLSWQVVDPSGEDFTCGLTTGGVPYCWGWEGYASPSLFISTVPVPVGGTHVFSSLVTSFAAACALDATGQAWCWGAGISGSLGFDTLPLTVFQPVPMKPALKFTQLSAGLNTICGLAAAGDAYCWGDNWYRSAAEPKDCYRSCPAPVLVSGGHHFVAISSGGRITCGLTAGGAAWCWGTTTLGLDSTVVSDRPFRVGHPAGAPVGPT